MNKIYNNVTLGNNVIIEEFCVIGKPPKGLEDGELETIIGENSTIRSGTVIYAGNKIGNNFQTGHNCVIREENQIGDNVSIGTLSCIEHHIIIENGARIHSQVFIPEFSHLEENSWIGPNVVITNARYPKSRNVKENLKGAKIEKNAKIGANSTLLPGITIKESALVGAGSVVTKDVPENTIVAGNPAKKIRLIEETKEY